eukprot:GHVS01017070.1.p1 GENE.GHVS01017070.1~~GHVS01017070.1.p1  ORF type:complete len:835 (+),score=206.58 GHVS01017070.1:270-2774(+)
MPEEELPSSPSSASPSQSSSSSTTDTTLADICSAAVVLDTHPGTPSSSSLTTTTDITAVADNTTTCISSSTTAFAANTIIDTTTSDSPTTTAATSNSSLGTAAAISTFVAATAELISPSADSTCGSSEEAATTTTSTTCVTSSTTSTSGGTSPSPTSPCGSTDASGPTTSTVSGDCHASHSQLRKILMSVLSELFLSSATPPSLSEDCYSYHKQIIDGCSAGIESLYPYLTIFGPCLLSRRPPSLQHQTVRRYMAAQLDLLRNPYLPQTVVEMDGQMPDNWTPSEEREMEMDEGGKGRPDLSSSHPSVVASAAASAALSWGRRESNSEYFSSFDLLPPDHYLLHMSPTSANRNSVRSGVGEEWDQTRPTSADMPPRRATRRLAPDSGMTSDVLSDHSLTTPTSITPPATDSTADFGGETTNAAAAFSYADIPTGALPSASSTQAISCDVPGVQWIPTYQYWRARWTDKRTNDPTSRYFSAKRYGFERAQKLAISARLKAESRGLARMKSNAESEGEEHDEDFFKQMEADLSPEHSPSLPPCSFPTEEQPPRIEDQMRVKPETTPHESPHPPACQQQQQPQSQEAKQELVRKKKRMDSSPTSSGGSSSLMRQHQHQQQQGGGPIIGGQNSLGVLMSSMKNPNASPTASGGGRGPEWRKDYRCWQVALTDSSGCKWLYFFSAKKHGIEKSREMALACQRTGVPKGAVQLSTIQKLHATKKMKSEMSRTPPSYHSASCSSAPVPPAPIRPSSLLPSPTTSINLPPSPRPLSSGSSPVSSNLLNYSGSSAAADYYASMANAAGGLGGEMGGLTPSEDLGGFRSYMTGLQGGGMDGSLE